MSQLRSIVERIERVEEEIKALNDDKRDIYAEAKSNGFDVKALKAVVARRRKDPNEVEEFDAVVETYLAELKRGTVPAINMNARVHVHEAAPTVPAEPPPSPISAAPEVSATPVITAFPDIPDFLDRRSPRVPS
jgi:uncharacterized protein (UPF0335 family)